MAIKCNDILLRNHYGSVAMYIILCDHFIYTISIYQQVLLAFHDFSLKFDSYAHASHLEYVCIYMML